MDEISGKLTQILNDPEQIRQIMDLAKNAGLISPETAASMETVETMNQMNESLQRMNRAGEKQEALFHALRPYLKPNRQTRLDRALQLAKLSHLAEAALRSSSAEGGSGHV